MRAKQFCVLTTTESRAKIWSSAMHGLQYVIVFFPDHTHLSFFALYIATKYCPN